MYSYGFSCIYSAYDRVLNSLVTITRALKLLPGAQAQLTQLYQLNRWLDITEKPNADELVTLALEKIKVDSNQYDLFFSMLRSITGMEDIVRKVTSGKSHNNHLRVSIQNLLS